ncbi:MAG: M14 family zinc carboxypeptidase [bacterium]
MMRILIILLLALSSTAFAISHAPSNVIAPPKTSAPWLTRVYFVEPSAIKEWASKVAPLEINAKQSYALFAIQTPELWNAFRQSGFKLAIDEKAQSKWNRLVNSNNIKSIPGFSCYKTVEETFNRVEQLMAQYAPSGCDQPGSTQSCLAEWIDIGDSWEKQQNSANGYDLKVLKITNRKIQENKPIFFGMSSMHARELTPAATTMAFAELLLSQYGQNADVTWLLDHHEVQLLLQANPDGRKQAETGLLWRKNTNNNFCSNTETRGIDLNRNYPFEWGNHNGSSTVACDTTFRGPLAQSEPETQAVVNYVESIFPDQRPDDLTVAAPDDTQGIFIDFHSYSGLVLWPWGFTETVAPNGIAMQTLGRKFAWFNNYTPEQSVGLYATDGTTDDFAYGDLGLPAYTFELGTEFFQDCATYETQIMPDNLNAMLYAAKVARAPYLWPAGPDIVDLNFNANIIAPGTSLEITANASDTRFNNSEGTEPTQNIASANAWIDHLPWVDSADFSLSASDGSFDSANEQITGSIDTTGLADGVHTLYIQGSDASGSIGAPSASFFTILDPANAVNLDGNIRNQFTQAPVEASLSLGQVNGNTNASGYYQLLLPGGTYDMTIQAEGFVSQTVSGLDFTAGQNYTRNIQLEPYCDFMQDDIEAGSVNWSAESPWAITTENANSPSHSWTDSPGGNYDNNQSVSLTSEVLDLSLASEVSLHFASFCDTENNYDYGHVEVSTGSGWTEVWRCTAEASWKNVSIDLGSLAGQSQSQIRFRFSSDSSVTRDGWFVDDIQLITRGTCANVEGVFSNGFESP